jgi:hypothetical protein
MKIVRNGRAKPGSGNNPRFIRNIFTTIVLFVLGSSLFAETAFIEYFDGEVWIARGEEEFIPEFGEPVNPGDLIVTGEDGIAIIHLNERAQVKLRENTELWVDSIAEKTSVTLESGGVFARFAKTAVSLVRGTPQFEIRTPSVVAGVRGTEFFVAYGRTVEEEPDLWLCVNEGSVEVEVPSTGQSTFVEEGEGINILAGRRATEPQFYPWTLDLNWNFDSEAGEVIDDTDLDAAYADLLDQDYD